MKTIAQPEPAMPELPRHGAGEPRVLDSASLLGENREVRILHDGEIYRLRRTRQGKLILTK